MRSQDACNRAADKLWSKAAYRRLIAEWDCEMMILDTGVPVWIGDVVEIAGLGNHRIQSLDVNLRMEPNEQNVIGRRRCHYVGELLQDQEDSRGLGHTQQKERSLMEMVLGWKAVGRLPSLERERYLFKPVISVR